MTIRYRLSMRVNGCNIEPDAKRTSENFVDVTLTEEISKARVAEGPTA